MANTGPAPHNLARAYGAGVFNSFLSLRADQMAEGVCFWPFRILPPTSTVRFFQSLPEASSRRLPPGWPR